MKRPRKQEILISGLVTKERKKFADYGGEFVKEGPGTPPVGVGEGGTPSGQKNKNCPIEKNGTNVDRVTS